jgi:rhodanese-related sulfurtransferase
MQEITVIELKKNKALYTILDVREVYERDEEGYIPEAVHIPLSDINNGLEKFLKANKGKNIVVHCHTGKRSASVIEALIEEDMFPKEMLYNLQRGFEAWILDEQ